MPMVDVYVKMENMNKESFNNVLTAIVAVQHAMGKNLINILVYLY